MRWSTCSLAAGLLIAGWRAEAQTAVREEDFLRAVGEASPAVVALGSDLAAAESQRRRAGLVPNPRLEATREQPADVPSQDTWLVAWTPPLDGRYGLARRAADQGVAAARENLALDRLRLRQEARRAFAEWALAHERADLVSAQLEAIAALAQAMAARAEKGEESGLAAGRLRLAAAETRADAATANSDRLRAAAAIRAWDAGLSEQARPVRPALFEPPEPMTASSPEINALAAEVEKAAIEQRLAGRLWGFPELQLGWQRIDQNPVAARGPVFGLSWSVPLFDRGQPERALAQRRREIAEARLELAKRRIAAQVDAAGRTYRGLLDAVRTVSGETAASPGLREAAIASFRAGETSVTDLLDTLRSVLAAQVRELELYSAALDAQRSLELAAGRPLGGQP